MNAMSRRSRVELGGKDAWKILEKIFNGLNRSDAGRGGDSTVGGNGSKNEAKRTATTRTEKTAVLDVYEKLVESKEVGTQYRSGDIGDLELVRQRERSEL